MNENKNNILKSAAIDALGTALYVAVVASFMFYGPKFFESGKPDTVFAPIMMLLLFVFSAALTGSLMFGRPVIWFLDGKKKEALSLLIYTLLIFFILTVVAFSLFYYTF